jgi:hypothetical protein
MNTQNQITPDFSHRIIEPATSLENFIYSLSAMLDRSDSILSLLMSTAEIERDKIVYGALDAARCEIKDVKQFARAYSKSAQ